MGILRKFAAVGVMALTVIGLLLCAGGLVGAWAVNEPTTTSLTGALDLVDQALGQTGQSVASVETLVAGITQQLNDLSVAAGDLSAEEQALVQAQVAALVEPIGQLSQFVATLGAGAAALNSTLRSMDRVPGLAVPAPPPGLDVLETQLATLSANLAEFEETVASAEYDGARVARGAALLAEQAGNVETQLRGWVAELTATQQKVASTEAQVPGLIDLTSLGLTALMLLFGAGQVSLFIHALRWFRGG